MTPGYVQLLSRKAIIYSPAVLLNRLGKYLLCLIRVILPVSVIRPNHPDLLSHSSAQDHWCLCQSGGAQHTARGPRAFPCAADLPPLNAHWPVTPALPSPTAGCLSQGVQVNIPQTQHPRREVQTVHQLFSGNLLRKAAWSEKKKTNLLFLFL